MKKKLSLDQLKVKSFVTYFNSSDSYTVKGGGATNGPGCGVFPTDDPSRTICQQTEACPNPTNGCPPGGGTNACSGITCGGPACESAAVCPTDICIP
ncbi:pinensin family lanthipeptide [Ekhidna sp.]